jgi:hypothetical protein
MPANAMDKDDAVTVVRGAPQNSKHVFCLLDCRVYRPVWLIQEREPGRPDRFLTDFHCVAAQESITEYGVSSSKVTKLHERSVILQGHLADHGMGQPFRGTATPMQSDMAG